MLTLTLRYCKCDVCDKPEQFTHASVGLYLPYSPDFQVGGFQLRE